MIQSVKREKFTDRRGSRSLRIRRFYIFHTKEFKRRKYIYGYIYRNGIFTYNCYRDILRVNQFPIVPAYAITIHKSQGLTFKKIACDISMCFAPGQAYVALSRCSSLEGLNLLKKINVDMIITNSHVVEFYEKQRINANLDRLLFLGDDEKSNQNIL